MTLRLRLLTFWLRHVEKRRLARAEPIAARAGFERQGRMFRNPPFALYLDDEIAGQPVTWVSAGPLAGRRRQILMWVHGGAHVMGSPATHRAMVARLGAMTGLRACLHHYRKAPEHPFPASLDDSRAVWDALVAAGHAPGDIVLGGDSSGGGVMLALLAELLAAGQRPAAVVAIAPFTDLTGAGASWRENAERESFLPAQRLHEVIDLFLAGHDPADPRCSPLFARFPDCPPVFLQVSAGEVLRDDTLRMVEHLRTEGAEVELDLWDDCPHVWAMFQGMLPEADAALANIAVFLRGRLAA